MTKNRLEAFSDGVLAIVITIMVLELKVPEEPTFESLLKGLPLFLSYIISFIYIGIYWNNHHHLFHITQKVNGKILWSNLHLLFWLSLIPFTTAWLGESYSHSAPVSAYGFVLLMSSIAYNILQHNILKNHDEKFILRNAIGKDFKGKASILLNIIGVGVSFINTYIAIAAFVIVAAWWLVPEQRIEKISE
ncbi:TMEM175 family protein [Arcticibacterium luteifluviistationis]|uniref:DUF1211 domain-containing protein n=1 Tax=Arcticibacterium luteifluviistationis TaxID=1784714 RepID=A0A2Z4G8C1_9BACT|nr:TMEM175 family protein [Arcticibacterium luteifluviistationis]AWV97427.1 hypothetical protein DJ013_04265 [Arcticibacterium luteifluviistationis]